MKKPLKYLIIISLLVSLCVSSVYSEPANEWIPVTVTDDFNNTIKIDKEPLRIISLSPSNTEILFALGLGDRVVGVTTFCNYPEKVKSIDKIGGFEPQSIDIEKITTKKPDLILVSFGNGYDNVKKLKKQGFTVICLNPKNIQDTIKNIELIGKSTGRSSEAITVIESIKTKIDTVNDKLKNSIPVKTFYCCGVDPIFVAGKNTFIDDIITKSGANNCFKDVKRWGTVDIERIITENPECIIVDSNMDAKNPDSILNYFYNESRLKDITAVKERKIYSINGDMINRAGPRIGDAVTTVATILHPEIFSSTQPDLNHQHDDINEQHQTSNKSTIMITIIIGIMILVGVYLIYRRQK
ncbi:MAG TPA: ABC transporter substrate-binding protein [Methanocorpusculum sp.]|nr:ABC transporter substrate-binding protein [Methanocorpusculum sp.]